MIVDLNVAGVFIPGLVVLALVALIATMAVIRLCTAIGILRLFAYRPLIEIATFLIIYAVLAQYPPLIGPIS
ncbi:MAG: DUF1656 domain-containing protein [Pseudomonadota bacterium]